MSSTCCRSRSSSRRRRSARPGSSSRSWSPGSASRYGTTPATRSRCRTCHRPGSALPALDPEILANAVVGAGDHGGKAVVRVGGQGLREGPVHGRRGLVVVGDHVEVALLDRGDVAGVPRQLLALTVHVADVERGGELAWLGIGVIPEIVDRHLVHLDQVTPVGPYLSLIH